MPVVPNPQPLDLVVAVAEHDGTIHVDRLPVLAWLVEGTHIEPLVPTALEGGIMTAADLRHEEHAVLVGHGFCRPGDEPDRWATEEACKRAYAVYAKYAAEGGVAIAPYVAPFIPRLNA